MKAFFLRVLRVFARKLLLSLFSLAEISSAKAT